MIQILFKRLLEMAMIDDISDWKWPGSDVITLEDVLTRVDEGLQGTSEPYGDTWEYPVKTNRDTEYHIARIIYFLDHPEEIFGIEVDNPCIDGGILPGCQVTDGYHRIAAGIILGLKHIDISYGGRMDVEDYLTGKSDVRPDDIIGVW